MRAYVASPADLKQLNAPPAPRAAARRRPGEVGRRHAVVTQAALRERAAVCRVAGGRRRRPKTVPRDAADGAEYGRRPAGDGPERANALDVVLLRRCRRLAVAVAARPQRPRVLRPVGVGVDGRVVERAVAAGVNKNEYYIRQGPPPTAPRRRWPPRIGAAPPRRTRARRRRSRPSRVRNRHGEGRCDAAAAPLRRS